MPPTENSSSYVTLCRCACCVHFVYFFQNKDEYGTCTLSLNQYNPNLTVLEIETSLAETEMERLNFYTFFTYPVQEWETFFFRKYKTLSLQQRF